MEGYLQGALRKELRIAPFALKKLLWEGFTDAFCSTWDNLVKHWISSGFFLVEGYVQGTLRKKLYIVPFVECFKTIILGKRH